MEIFMIPCTVSPPYPGTSSGCQVTKQNSKLQWGGLAGLNESKMNSVIQVNTYTILLIHIYSSSLLLLVCI